MWLLSLFVHCVDTSGPSSGCTSTLSITPNYTASTCRRLPWRKRRSIVHTHWLGASVLLMHPVRSRHHRLRLSSPYAYLDARRQTTLGERVECHQHGPPLSISTDRRRYTSPPLNCDVLSLEFFSCTGCGTVYADIEEPPICDVCESRQFTTIESEVQARSYFTRS